jgi:hypothetical protein
MLPLPVAVSHVVVVACFEAVAEKCRLLVDGPVPIDGNLAVEQRAHADLCAIVQAVGFADGGEMIADHGRYHAQASRNLFGVEALAEQVHHFALSIGQTHRASGEANG